MTAVIVELFQLLHTAQLSDFPVISLIISADEVRAAAKSPRTNSAGELCKPSEIFNVIIQSLATRFEKKEEKRK